MASVTADMTMSIIAMTTTSSMSVKPLSSRRSRSRGARTRVTSASCDAERRQVVVSRRRGLNALGRVCLRLGLRSPLRRQASPRAPASVRDRARSRSRVDSLPRSPRSHGRRDRRARGRTAPFEKVCISKNSPSSIASGISSPRLSRMSSAMRAFDDHHLDGRDAPTPDAGRSRWLTTPRRTPARIRPPAAASRAGRTRPCG